MRVELELRNGETRTIYREEPVYLQPEDNIAKLDEHCSADLGELRLARIVDMIMKLDQLKTPGELLDLFIKESDHGKL